jgi:hypothetical protein
MIPLSPSTEKPPTRLLGETLMPTTMQDRKSTAQILSNFDVSALR